jgi:hypothetical protein
LFHFFFAQGFDAACANFSFFAFNNLALQVYFELSLSGNIGMGSLIAAKRFFVAHITFCHGFAVEDL